LLAEWWRDPLLRAMLELHGLAADENLIPEQQLVRRAGRCELCGESIADAHGHLFDEQERTLVCACQACQSCFPEGTTARYVAIRSAVSELPSELDDATWQKLGLPIDLAYFVRGRDGGFGAYFPSPAGAVRADLSPEAERWLADFVPDLVVEKEAIVTRRRGQKREAYRVSIDRAFGLVGDLQRGWSGFGGGLHTEIDRVFHALRTSGGFPA
jgi:hypothetical protein